MANSLGRKWMHRADYSAIAEWSPNLKASVAEAIAVNSLQQGLKDDPVRWTTNGVDKDFRSADPRSRHHYDKYYDELDDGESRWRPDGFFYTPVGRVETDNPGPEDLQCDHIVLQEVKTGETVPDIRDSQFKRMKEYAHRPDATVYYSFVEFVEDGFNLSMAELKGDGPDGTQWWFHDAPPGTGRPVEEIEREERRERQLWMDYLKGANSEDTES